MYARGTARHSDTNTPDCPPAHGTSCTDPGCGSNDRAVGGAGRGGGAVRAPGYDGQSGAAAPTRADPSHRRSHARPDPGRAPEPEGTASRRRRSVRSGQPPTSNSPLEHGASIVDVAAEVRENIPCLVHGDERARGRWRAVVVGRGCHEPIHRLRPVSGGMTSRSQRQGPWGEAAAACAGRSPGEPTDFGEVAVHGNPAGDDGRYIGLTAVRVMRRRPHAGRAHQGPTRRSAGAVRPEDLGSGVTRAPA